MKSHSRMLARRGSGKFKVSGRRLAHLSQQNLAHDSCSMSMPPATERAPTTRYRTRPWRSHKAASWCRCPAVCRTYASPAFSLIRGLCAMQAAGCMERPCRRHQSDSCRSCRCRLAGSRIRSPPAHGRAMVIRIRTSMLRVLLMRGESQELTFWAELSFILQLVRETVLAKTASPPPAPRQCSGAWLFSTTHPVIVTTPSIVYTPPPANPKAELPNMLHSVKTVVVLSPDR
jgi:hypothetical protein